MKKTVFLLVGLLTSLSLQAEPGEGRGPKGEGKGPRGGDRTPPAEIIEKFDTDGDGKLNDEERKAARAAHREIMEKRRAEMLAKYDTDKDGKLSADERKAAMLDRFDTDKDGVLSDAEKEAAKSEIRRGGHGPRGEGRGPRGGGRGKKRESKEA